MRTMAMRAAASAAVVAMAFGAVPSAVSAQGSQVDVSGTWTFSVETGAGSGEPTVTLQQKGKDLTGHYSSQTFGEQDLTGTVDGQNIEIVINAEVQGTALTVTYRGTIESHDAMKGDVDLGGLGSGTWTAKRK
jgi:hypothetical protein